jgi:hypothetical protein
LFLFTAFAAGTPALDFHAGAKRLVALEFLQSSAHVREAVGEEKRGREEERKKKGFHGLSDNAFVERFKPKRDGQRVIFGSDHTCSSDCRQIFLERIGA